MIFKNLRRTRILNSLHITLHMSMIPRYNSFYIPYSSRVNIIWKYHGQKDGLKVYICKYIVKNLLLQLNITFIKITIIIGLGSPVYYNATYAINFVIHRAVLRSHKISLSSSTIRNPDVERNTNIEINS